MKLFVDSANLTEIEAARTRGFASGVTTNPSILAKEEKRDYREILRDIINLITKFGPPLPLSVPSPAGRRCRTRSTSSATRPARR